MNRWFWFVFRHPFIAAGLAGLVGFAVAIRLDFSVKVAAIAGLGLIVFVLVLWWPRHGLHSRDVDQWLSDEDPRVRKPDPKTDG
jgi:hypothetical protein